MKRKTGNKYIVTVYDSASNMFKDVALTEEQYKTYMRTEWNIKDNNKSYYSHEIQFSSLIGGEDCNYERFHEFTDDSLELTVMQRMDNAALKQALSTLSQKDRNLIFAIYFEGMSERAYADTIGISQQGVHKQKEKILDYLKKIMKKGC